MMPLPQLVCRPPIVLLALLLLDLATVRQAQADLLAASYAYSAVFRYEDDGTPIGGIPGFPGLFIPFNSGGLNQAAGVTVGPDGNIYVSSLASGEILFYDGTTGAPLTSPHEGEPAGLFGRLVNDGNEEMPVGGPGPLRFGPDGNLYVADFNGNSIRVFDGQTGIEGAPAAVMAEQGPIPAGQAGSVTFGPDGAIYVGDFNTASVYRFEDGVGNFFVTPQSGGLFGPSSLLFLPNDHLLVSDLVGNKLIEYDESGQFVKVFAEIPPFGNPPGPQNPFGSNSPSDLAIDQDGNIVLSVLGYSYDPPSGQILRFDLEGNPLGDPAGTPVVDDAPTLSSVAWIKSVDAVTGDFDGDGFVTSSDYAKWKSDYGKVVAKGGGADGNGDGVVNAADYTVWRDNLPEILELGGGGRANVPEPSIAALAMIGLLFACMFRK